MCDGSRQTNELLTGLRLVIFLRQCLAVVATAAGWYTTNENLCTPKDVVFTVVEGTNNYPSEVWRVWLGFDMLRNRKLSCGIR